MSAGVEGIGLEKPSSALSSTLPPPPDSMELLNSIAQSNLSGNTSGSPSSSMIISPFGELLVSLIQLAMQNEQVFKETAAEASAKLQQQAEQNNSTQEQQYLNKMAAAMQEAAQTGQLPQLPTPPANATQTYSRSGQVQATNTLSGVNTDPSEPSLTDILTMLTTQTKAAMQVS